MSQVGKQWIALDMAGRPPLPPELAALEEKHPGGVIQETRTFCTLHGPQDGLSCAACDEFFPEQVQARKSAEAPTILVKDVQAMINKAVQQAVSEAIAFERWKASEEGQQALAEKQATSPPPLRQASITQNPEQVTGSEAQPEPPAPEQPQ